MGKTKEGIRYQSISLSVDFIKEIKEYIIHDPKYRSIADYTRDALMEKMERDSSSAIKRYSDLLKMMESKGFKKEIRDIRKRGVPEEVEVLRNVKKELEVDKEAKRKQEEQYKAIIDLYQKKKGLQQVKKEPVIQLPESKFNELIQRIEMLEKEKRHKKKLS